LLNWRRARRSRPHCPSTKMAGFPQGKGTHSLPCAIGAPLYGRLAGIPRGRAEAKEKKRHNEAEGRTEVQLDEHFGKEGLDNAILLR